MSRLRLVSDVCCGIRHVDSGASFNRTRIIAYRPENSSVRSALSIEQIGERQSQHQQKKTSCLCKHGYCLLVAEDEFDLVQPFLAKSERKAAANPHEGSAWARCSHRWKNTVKLPGKKTFVL